jgi:hypothetical protein
MVDIVVTHHGPSLFALLFIMAGSTQWKQKTARQHNPDRRGIMKPSCLEQVALVLAHVFVAFALAWFCFILYVANTNGG